MQHLIYINFQILFLTVYTVCIYLGTPTVLLFHYPIPKNQRMNAKYNVAVEENKCSILYHRNIIQCCITCFILQTSLAIITNADCVSRLACGEGDEEVPAMLTGGGAGSCPSQPVPTAQPGWAMGAVLSCRARAQHSSQDRAVLLKSPGHRTDLWQEASGQLPLGTTCVALPLSDSTARSFHRTIIPDYSWQGCPLVSKSC